MYACVQMPLTPLQPPELHAPGTAPQQYWPAQGPVVHLPFMETQFSHDGPRFAEHVKPASRVETLVDTAVEGDLKGSTPRALPQLLTLWEQLKGSGTYVIGLEIEGRIRRYCDGVPIRITNVDQAPSLPSQFCDGVNGKG